MQCKCPRCGSDAVNKYGRSKNGKKRYICLVCNRQFVEGAKDIFPERPQCPRCGGTMSIYKYEENAVRFRCVNYPNCREYIKVKKEKMTV